jgi:AGZA family xanthine/uracil permease-like MFS transporter
MDTDIEGNRADALPPSRWVEFVAGLSTYLTLSYIFLLNPILLTKAGINLSAAFFATVVSATLATLLMGLWAKVPFAVAPAPSITTFFVSYVCLKLGLPWQAALAAVVLSGVLSIVMTFLSVRGKLIDSMPPALRVGVLFAVSGFLIANGLTQAKLISYSDGFIDISKLSASLLGSPNAVILCTGLLVTLVFRLKWIKFSGAPLLGILAASITAASFGIKSTSQAEFSTAMFSAALQLDFSALADSRFLIAILVFFIIDFFGGVGKYVGLFAAMGREAERIPPQKIERALYVDGIGNVFGGLLGASSLAVFVSSAVGIVAGGRTGLTALVIAGFMLASLVITPLVGAVPVEATSGILVFVGFLLIPYKDIFSREGSLTRFGLGVCLIAALVSFLTYGIDKAILLVFFIYSIIIIKNGVKKADIILLVVTALLMGAVLAQSL